MTRASTRGQPRPWARGPRPQVWITGPDPVVHKKYHVWLQQRNQALFRSEGWHIDFEVWCEIWGDLWPNRGRQRGDLCMTRHDWDAPWTRENVMIVTRSQHARRQGQARAAGWSSVTQQARRARKKLP